VNKEESVWVCGMSSTFDVGLADHQGCQYGLSNMKVADWTRLIGWVVELCHQDTINQQVWGRFGDSEGVVCHM